MNDLISRKSVWNAVGDLSMTVRPGSKLDGVIKRYANAIDNAPTVDAIPVEWLREKREDMIVAAQDAPARAIGYVLLMWQKEKEG